MAEKREDGPKEKPGSGLPDVFVRRKSAERGGSRPPTARDIKAGMLKDDPGLIKAFQKLSVEDLRKSLEALTAAKQGGLGRKLERGLYDYLKASLDRTDELFKASKEGIPEDKLDLYVDEAMVEAFDRLRSEAQERLAEAPLTDVRRGFTELHRTSGNIGLKGIEDVPPWQVDIGGEDGELGKVEPSSTADSTPEPDAKSVQESKPAMSRDILMNVASAVIGAAILGLLAWGYGVQVGVGDLDARTKALNESLERAARNINDNTANIAAGDRQLETLRITVDNLAKSLDRSNQNLTKAIEQATLRLNESVERSHQNLTQSIDRLVADVREDRQASREERQSVRQELDALRALARDNATAIRDLLNEGRQPQPR